MSRRSGAGAAAALIAACIFGAALLVSLITGAGVYRQVQDRTDRASADRLGLGYITAKIHAKDEEGAIRADTFAGADALVLTEAIGADQYETILYVYDGWLMELFCEKGWDLGPEAGQQITQAQSLRVSQDGGLVRLAYTDADGRTETADVYLRSEG
ncbi:MAG: DUF4860 domain-containing protein [Oscillospiraceae bacterium]|nr:DUF4860 domain-containing protein [Oscillospiraceae bacterium]